VSKPDETSPAPVEPAPAAEEPSEQRTYSSEQMAHAIRDRLARQAKSHEAALATVAEQAASAAAARVRAQVEEEWSALLSEADIDVNEAIRMARLKRLFRSSARKNRSLRKGY
jgi:phage protein D